MMNLKALLKSFSFYSYRSQLVIFSTFIKHKLKETSEGDPSVFIEFIRIAGYLNAGIKILSYHQEKFLFKYQINNLCTLSYLRRYSSDFDVFTEVIMWKEYSILTKYFDAKSEVKYIIDAGGNIGLTSLYLHRFFPNASIICIEPDTNNYYILKKNLEVNKTSKIIALNKALWINNLKLKVVDDYRDGREWSLTVKQAENSVNSSLTGITLSEILSEQSFPYVDMLKIDIEGGEKVLFSNDNFLESIKMKVKCLVIEIHDTDQYNKLIHTKMEEFGFQAESFSGVTLFRKKVSLLE